MAIDEADQSDAGQFSGGEASEPASDGQEPDSKTVDNGARLGEYTWADFMVEYGYGDDVSTLYPDDQPRTDDQLGLDTEAAGPAVPSGDDWDRVEFDPETYLGFNPDWLESLIADPAKPNAERLWDAFLEYVDPETTPVTKGVYTWEHYKWEYYYESDGSRPRDGSGEIIPHDKQDALGLDSDETIEQQLSFADNIAMELDDVIDERTVNVQEELDEDEFFSTTAGNTTVTNRYDLEKAVPFKKKTHFREVERYWVNKPYAFVIIFHSEKENEKKYYMIEPYQNEIEMELSEFLSKKLRTAIKYSEDSIKQRTTEEGRRNVIEREARRLLKRYDLFEKPPETSKSTSGSASEDGGIIQTLRSILDDDDEAESSDTESEESPEAESTGTESEELAEPNQLHGIKVRPEPAILADDPDTLNEYQVEKLLYSLKRNFIGYERIDGIKHDINVEDISCNGYNSPVFVYHSEYEQIISNIYHGKEELDDFVVKLAQRSGKGISKRLPQVDATLPDGSRSQLTLGAEVSDHGTNYTIRQFKDVPFTPVDLINWNTFSLDEMAFLWLAIENHKSLIFAGGTASGKTTSLNAISLFIPSSTKIVSIEDTREVELPQRNWIASVTRPSFSDDEQGDVDEFDLLEAALRQRPDYIVMGEIRGEEGRTLFQVMSTGHTTYTTFHADSVDEVLKRFTTDPINVSKTMFTALDLVSIQTQTRVQGNKVRRNKSLTEINHYDAEHDEINVQDVYQWQAETDEYLKMGDSNTLQEIQFDRGWNREKLEEELFKREVILAYLIKNGLNTYAEVAATVQAFINDADTIFTLIANGQLEESLDDLREMESVIIDVDQEKEELVPRPDATDETYNLSMDILERAEESLFEEYRGKSPSGLAETLGDIEEEETIEVDRAQTDEFDFEGTIDGTVSEDEWELGDGATTFGNESATEEPAWLDDDTGFDIGGTEATAEANTATETQPTAEANTATETQPTAEADAAAETPSEATTGTTDLPAAQDTSSDSESAATETESAATTETSEAATQNAETASEELELFSSNDSSDSDDGGLDGLFSNMGKTLDKMERESAAEPETQPEETGAQPDTSGFDAMFPDDDLGSIFDPDADDTDEQETETLAEQDSNTKLETIESTETAIDTTTDDADNDTPVPTETADSTTESTTDDSKPAGSDSETDDRSTLEDDEPSTADEEPPTIDLGTEPDEQQTDEVESADDPFEPHATGGDDDSKTESADDSDDDPSGGDVNTAPADEPSTVDEEPPTIDLGTEPDEQQTDEVESTDDPFEPHATGGDDDSTTESADDPDDDPSGGDVNTAPADEPSTEETTPPTIDLGTEPDEQQTDEVESTDDPFEPAATEHTGDTDTADEPGDGPSSTDDEPKDVNTATDDETDAGEPTPPTIDLGEDPAEADAPSQDESGGTETDTERDTATTDDDDESIFGDESGGTKADTGRDTATTDDDDESIFGDESGGIFSDDADENDDGEPLFSETGDESPFGDAEDEDSPPDEDSIFGSDDEDEQNGIFSDSDEERDT